MLISDLDFLSEQKDDVLNDVDRVKDRSVSVVLLAGGKGKRMGVNTCLLLFSIVPFFQLGKYKHNYRLIVSI